MVRPLLILSIALLLILPAGCSNLRPDVRSGRFSASFSGLFSFDIQGDAHLVSYEEAGFSEFVNTSDPDLAHYYQGFLLEYVQKDIDDEVTEQGTLQCLYVGSTPLDIGSYSLVDSTFNAENAFISRYQVEYGDTLDIYGSSLPEQAAAIRTSSISDEEIAGVITIRYSFLKRYSLSAYYDSLEAGGGLPPVSEILFFEENPLIFNGKFVASIED